MLEQIASVATAVGVVVAAAGVVIAAFSVRGANVQRRRQFETIFVQRYWSLIDRLSLDAQSGSERPWVGATDESAVRSYLRLCEDELELRKEGWISGETWAIWQAGIEVQLERWPFKPIWREVDLQTGPSRPDRARQEEFTLLRDFLANKQDPQMSYSRWKRLRMFVRRVVTAAP